MDRREFLSCSVATGVATTVAALSAFDVLANTPQKQYVRAQLTDALGDPLKASSILANTNYVFFYPFSSTPCFLLNLGKSLKNPAALKTQKGQTYGWQGGVGKQNSLVAYSAICAHKLAYPAKEVSFIRFQANKTEASDGGMIHCCADHSVYDPAAGAKVVSGPAQEPLAIVLIEWDAKTDGLFATGTLGAEQFDAFFQKYDFKLQMEYGNRAKQAVAAKTPVSELSKFCRNVAAC
jgi:arsenite oxidase small subunit